ncbi:MAG: methylenetetrahydrofolate reductase, partial [Bdellovibrionota bacterium]
MDHHYFGIRNILALRGDPPDGQPLWKPRDGGYNYAHELIKQIRDLNEGRYMTRPGGPAHDPKEKTDFCIGAAAYPEHVNLEERIRFFKIKADAGAQFGITDMLFDWEKYAKFRNDLARVGVTIPILPGTRLLKSRTQALKMMTKFKVTVPKDVLAALPESDGPDAIARGVELFLKLAASLQRVGAPGIHAYVISDTEGSSTALRELALRMKTSRK